MNRALAVAFLVGSLALTGCSAPIEGVVVGKDVDPGRSEPYQTTERRPCGTESWTETKGTGAGQRSVTKTRQKWCNNRVTKYRDVPPSWDLNIRKDDGQLQWVTVSRSQYSRIKIGERINTKDLR